MRTKLLVSGINIYFYFTCPVNVPAIGELGKVFLVNWVRLHVFFMTQGTGNTFPRVDLGETKMEKA